MARFSEAEKDTIWDMREAGVSVKRIAKHLGRQNCSLRTFIATTGGAPPRPRQRSALRLSLAEREEISRRATLRKPWAQQLAMASRAAQIC